MPGPSSSHTAAPFFIATVARRLLGEPLAAAAIVFDPGGSFAAVYRPQRSDIGFAAGLAALELTDPDFSRAFDKLKDAEAGIEFVIEQLTHREQPNSVELRLTGRSGARVTVNAVSIGGGAFRITHIEHFAVDFNGQFHAVFVSAPWQHAERLRELLKDEAFLPGEPSEQSADGEIAFQFSRTEPLSAGLRESLSSLQPPVILREAAPVFFVLRGQPLFRSAEEMVRQATVEGKSLGGIVLEYEAALLGLTTGQIIELILERYGVMERSVAYGMKDDVPLKLLTPSAKHLMDAEKAERLPSGGLPARAAARALAAMQGCAVGGLVCAAPTAGSAGVIPGVMVTLVEHLSLDRVQIAKALLAAAGVGLITAYRATFSAEVAGCQVEIGAASAMAAAAVVEAAGGSPQQAVDAAATAYQSTLGLVCDPVQGMVEIPCQVRNAAAAPAAFIHADLSMGGYPNPIPLDETIDAVMRVGASMPRALRCTALGGLAQTPSALKLVPREIG
jgi:L-serine dehydratase